MGETAKSKKKYYQETPMFDSKIQKIERSTLI